MALDKQVLCLSVAEFARLFAGDVTARVRSVLPAGARPVRAWFDHENDRFCVAFEHESFGSYVPECYPLTRLPQPLIEPLERVELPASSEYICWIKRDKEAL
jgi:hypothetical protein